MATFRSYSEQTDQRRTLLLGGALAVGVALANPRIRGQVIGKALGAMERWGNRFAGVARDLPLQSTVAEITNLFERTLPRAAQLASAENLARQQLRTVFQRTGSGIAHHDLDAFTHSFVQVPSMRGFLVNQAIDAPSTLAHADFQPLLARIPRAHHGAIEEALEQARAQVPSLHQVQESPAYRKIHQQLHEAVGTELHRLGQNGPLSSIPFLDRALRHAKEAVGVESVRLANAPARFQGTALKQGLQDFAGDEVLNKLHLGRVVSHQGKTYDLRGFHQTLEQIHFGILNHFQIPLAPGMSGINPLQLMPWRHGRLNRMVGEIGHHAVDSQLRAHLGTEAHEIGKDVYKVGSKWFAADFTSAEAPIQHLDIQGEMRSSLYGFMRRRAQTIEKAQAGIAGRAARSEDPLQNLLGELRPKNMLGHDEDSLWGRIHSVFTKFGTRSNWAPRVLGRVLNTAPEDVRPEDFQRTVGFLTSGRLSSRHQKILLRESLGTLGTTGDQYFNDPRLRELLPKLHEDQAVVDFYRRFGELSDRRRVDGPQTTALSENMRALVNHFQASPEGVFDRFAPGTDRAVAGWNLMGQDTHQNAIALMRQGILDEAALRVGLSSEDGFGVARLFTRHRPKTHELGKVGKWFDTEEDDTAIAWAYGHALKDIARPKSGESNLTSIEKAVQAFQQSQEAKAAAVRLAERRTHLWDSSIHPEEHVLRTSEVFSQRGRNLVTEMNEQLKAAQGDWSLAFRNTVRGPWGRQYAAFFTGNQRDVTETTLALEYFPRKLNSYFSEFGIPGTKYSLGLPDADQLSGKDIFQNLMLKRVLPVGVAYEAYRYADFEASKLGVPGPSHFYANVRSHIGIERARLAGTSILGVDRDLLPGLDKVVSDRTEEEEQKHQKNGYEAVRKGRFWAIGSKSEFWGDKIGYFLPSAVQAARSDWQGAPNVDLATADYWRHSFLPNPENFFTGPFSRLIDPDWFERKHSTGDHPDRPYPISAEAFDPNTLHGPILNSLIGGIVKPQKVLYPEYVPKSAGGTASREDLRRINESMKSGGDRQGVSLLVSPGGGKTPEGWPDLGVGSPGVLIPRGQGNGGVASVANITPAGQLTLENAPAGTSVGGGYGHGHGGGFGGGSGGGGGGHSGYGGGHGRRDQGARLSRWELAEINQRIKAGMGGGTTRGPSTTSRLATQKGVFTEEDLDLINPEDGSIVGARNAAAVAGLYGFFVESALPGSFKQDGLVIPTAQRAQGYNRRFYELELGGLGGALSEVGRRFIHRRQRFDGEWNPVPNNMASWLPGPEYMTDFKHGDPLTKIPRGEMRLPGEAYERLHPDLKLMETRASSLGGTVEELMQGMLFLREPLSSYGEQVTEKGNEIHKALQNRWKRMGILLSAEKRIYNPTLGISGHFDAILQTSEGTALTDIKTVSEKRYRTAMEKGPFSEHEEQVNYYMHETGIRNAFITYVNRDSLKEGRVETFFAPLEYSESRYQHSIGKVKEARHRLMGMVDQGTIHRGDLYDPVTRFEVLADVAPYSENYSQIREYLTQQNQAGDLGEEENARFQAAKKRSAAQKKRTQTYPYRFQSVDLESHSYTVQRILDANTIQVKESEHPLRLAGMRAAADRIEQEFGPAPEGTSAAEWMFQQYGIRPGSTVLAKTDRDPKHQVADDTLQSMHAVLYKHGRNINYDLLQRGVGTEKETDWSGTGVTARFTSHQLGQGNLWEKFAHLDTPLHSKFLRVRSPLEELERGIVYGKNTGSWQHPVRDYIVPSITSFTSRTPEMAGVGLGLFLSYFARTKEAKAATIIGGFVAGGLLATGRSVEELQDGKVWKPERTRKREELEEYWDTLKYVKLRGMATEEGRLARSQEGVNVDSLIRNSYQQGQQREKKRRFLEEKKRKLLLHGGRDSHGKEIDEIQDQLDKVAESHGNIALGKHATKAVLYTQMFRSTMYGIDPDETPFKNVFSAFPKYKRELIQGWVEHSDPEERQRIYSLLPAAEQRIIGRQLGVDQDKIPERPKLNDYFRKHPLPDVDWEGWQPGVDLEQLRIRALRGEGLDPMESGIYELQIDDAEQTTGHIPVPTLNGSGSDIQRTLNAMLSGQGLKNVRVQVDARPHDHEQDVVDVQLDLRQHREQDLRNALQLHG